MLATIAILSAVSVATIFGDYLIKLAAMDSSGIQSAQFMFGAALYGLSAIGWLYLMRDHSLLKISVMYSCSIIVMLSALGYFAFKEPAGFRQLIGGMFAIASVIIIG